MIRGEVHHGGCNNSADRLLLTISETGLGCHPVGGCHLLSKCIISKIIIYIIRHNILAPSQIRSTWRLNVVPNSVKNRELFDLKSQQDKKAARSVDTKLERIGKPNFTPISQDHSSRA